MQANPPKTRMSLQTTCLSMESSVQATEGCSATKPAATADHVQPLAARPRWAGEQLGTSSGAPSIRTAGAAVVAGTRQPPRGGSQPSFLYKTRQRRRQEQQQYQHWQGQGPGGPGLQPPDARLARLARELVAGIPQGGEHMRQLLLEAQLSNAEARQLLSCLGRFDAADVALAAFRCMCEQGHPAWTGDPVLYTKLMQMFSQRSGSAAVALEVFEEMQRDGVAPDLVAYNCALTAAGKANKWSRLHSLLACMEAAGVERDAFTYTSLLHACQHSGRWQQAVDWFAEMEAAAAAARAATAAAAPEVTAADDSVAAAEITAAAQQQQAQGQLQERLRHQLHERPLEEDRGSEACQEAPSPAAVAAARLAPNVVHYTTLMSVLQRAGRWEQAMEAFEKMEAAGVVADVQAYNVAITACAKGLDWEKAWAVFAAMRRAGVEPSIISYNALVSACERCGQADRALEVVRNMRRKGLTPNAVSYNTLISAFGKAGRYQEAVRLHQLMGEAGVPDDVFTLSSLIRASEKGGRWRQAKLHFDDFQQRGVAPNTVAYNALISALGSSGRWQMALEVFQAMREDPHPSVAPDIVTYGSLIAALERGGQWHRALEVYDQMQAEGWKANGYIITSLLNACEKGGQWEKARELFGVMQNLGMDMDSMTMVARKAVYAFPWLISTLPAPLVKAAQAAVESGRAARRWISKANSDLLAKAEENVKRP
ncbi:hypothetical protein N2152v2_004913 [Parachlorella kessleri]